MTHKNSIALGAGTSVLALALILSFAFGMPARANDDNNRENGDQKSFAHSLGSTFEVHISDSGAVLVRGAKVTAVSSTGFTAVSSWPDASMTWNVLANGATIIQRSNGTTSLSAMAVGDIASFSGTLTGGSAFTVQAKIVKDWSSSIPVNVKTTVEGKLLSVAATGLPTIFVLRSGNNDYTVKAATDTSILNALWLRSGLANFQIGDTVRVYGTVHSDNTIDATVVRDTSIR